MYLSTEYSWTSEVHYWITSVPLSRSSRTTLPSNVFIDSSDVKWPKTGRDVIQNCIFWWFLIQLGRIWGKSRPSCITGQSFDEAPWPAKHVRRPLIKYARRPLNQVCASSASFEPPNSVYSGSGAFCKVDSSVGTRKCLNVYPRSWFPAFSPISNTVGTNFSTDMYPRSF